MVEHTVLSRRQAVAVAVADDVVLVELVVAAAAAIAVAAAIEEGVYVGVDEGAYVVARADAYAEVSASLSQSVAGFGIMCCRYLHAWP